MKSMTSKEIRNRLAEIAKEQAEHDAHDFDGELKEVMMNGGDVDALENAQLQAERTARRLRVEKQALESALPEAERREAEQELAAMASGMADHVQQYRAATHALTKLEEQIDQQQSILLAIDKTRGAAYFRAEHLRTKHGLPASVTEPFRRLTSSARDAAQFRRVNKQDVDGYVAPLSYSSSSVDVDQDTEISK